MFQLNDIELVGLSANLIFSLISPELQEENDSEIISVFAKSFATVESPAEIYGFSIIIYDLCNNFEIFKHEQSIIIQGVQNHLKHEIAGFIKTSLIKILKVQICPSLPEPTLQLIMQIIIQSIGDIQLHSEIFSCFSEIVLNFPEYTKTIFENVVPIAIQSLIQSGLNSQSIIYFFDSLISEDTVEYYQEIIPTLLPLLHSLVISEDAISKSDSSNLIENILRIYAGDTNELIGSIQEKSNLLILLNLISKTEMKEGEINIPFIASMINSQNQRERFMSIRLVKKMAKRNRLIDPLISECLNHLTDIAEIQYQVIGLLGEMHKYQSFPIEKFFESLLNFFNSEVPYLNDISSRTLKNVIKFSRDDQVALLVPPVLLCFEQSLANPSTFENLIGLSTLIQSISFRLNEKYAPFAEKSFELLHQMSSIDQGLLVHTFSPVAAIASRVKFLPFFDEFLNAMLSTLNSAGSEYQQRSDELNSPDFDDFCENVETTIDVIIDSVSFLLNAFDMKPAAFDFLSSYFAVFGATHYIPLFSGFNDILAKFPDLLELTASNLFQLLFASSGEIFDFISEIGENESKGDENEDESDENAGEKEFDCLDHDLILAADLINLIKVIVAGTDFEHPFVVFALHLVELASNLFMSSKEVKFVSLALLIELSKKTQGDVFEFIQSHKVIKKAILFGLNENDYHDLCQKLIDIFGAQNF